MFLTNARPDGDDLQQTGKHLHAIGDCSVEQDHDANAREAEITPERVGDERWALVFDLMVHPANKRRNSGESNDQQRDSLCSLDVIDIRRERPKEANVSKSYLQLSPKSKRNTHANAYDKVTNPVLEMSVPTQSISSLNCFLTRLQVFGFSSLGNTHTPTQPVAQLAAATR